MLIRRRPRRDPPKQRRDNHGQYNQQKVWILNDGTPVPVSIIIGSTDGQMTEVLSGDIIPGTPLLVDTVKKL